MNLLKFDGVSLNLQLLREKGENLQGNKNTSLKDTNLENTSLLLILDYVFLHVLCWLDVGCLGLMPTASLC